MSRVRSDIGFLVDLADAKGMKYEIGRFDANRYLTGAAGRIIQAKDQLTASQQHAEQMSERISDRMKTVLGDKAPSSEEILAYINELANTE